MKKKGQPLLAFFIVVALMGVAGACSAPSGTTAAKYSNANEAVDGESAHAPGAAGVDQTSFNADALNQMPINQGRAFVSSASVTVRTSDVGATKSKAITATEHAGGALFGEQTTFGDNAKATLTLKVPPEHFRPLLDELAGLGTLTSQEVKTDEVTAQVVDLEARRKAAEASLTRTQALMERAGSLLEVTNLEKEVARREGDLEGLTGQQRALMDRIDLATVTLTLDGTGQATPGAAQSRSTALPGFGDGLENGLRVAGTIGTLALATIGTLIPFLPLLVAGGVVIWALRRRGRQPESTPAA